MRAFIAIDFDNNVKKMITGVQEYFRAHTLSGRWKFIENFHLTLKFLDEINDRQLSEIDRALTEICSETGKFGLGIKSMGYFPGRDSVRVLWLGLDGDIERLGMLQTGIDTSLEKLGFPKDKRGYTPHVTIGQELVFDEKPEELIRSFTMPHFPKTIADRMYLFKSEQMGKRRVYTPIREYKFT